MGAGTAVGAGRTWELEKEWVVVWPRIRPAGNNNRDAIHTTCDFFIFFIPLGFT
jgi:hypothetical protein